jgi:hypothetical protein
MMSDIGDSLREMLTAQQADEARASGAARPIGEPATPPENPLRDADLGTSLQTMLKEQQAEEGAASSEREVFETQVRTEALRSNKTPKFDPITGVRNKPSKFDPDTGWRSEEIAKVDPLTGTGNFPAPTEYVLDSAQRVGLGTMKEVSRALFAPMPGEGLLSRAGTLLTAPVVGLTAGIVPAAMDMSVEQIDDIFWYGAEERVREMEAKADATEAREKAARAARPKTGEPTLGESVSDFRSGYDPLSDRGQANIARAALTSARILNRAQRDAFTYFGGGLPSNVAKIRVFGRALGISEKGAGLYHSMVENIEKDILKETGVTTSAASRSVAEAEAAVKFEKLYPGEIVLPSSRFMGMRVGPDILTSAKKGINALKDKVMGREPGTTQILRDIEHVGGSNPLEFWNPQTAGTAAARSVPAMRLAQDAVETLKRARNAERDMFSKVSQEAMDREVKAITNTGVIEMPENSAQFRREMAGLDPDQQAFVMARKNEAKIHLAVEQHVDAKTVGLGEADRLEMDRLQYDRGDAVRYVSVMQGRAREAVVKAEHQAVTLETLAGRQPFIQTAAKTMDKELEGLTTAGISGAEKEAMSTGAGISASTQTEAAKLFGARTERARGLREAGAVKAAGLEALAVKGERRVATLDEEIKMLEDNMSDATFLGHYITPEATVILESMGKKTYPGISSGVTSHHASQLRREFRGTIPDINALSESGTLPGYEGIRFKMFHDEPTIVSATRTVRHVRATDGSLLAKRVATVAWHPPESAMTDAQKYLARPQGYVKVTGGLAGHPSLAGTWVPKEINDSLQRVDKLFTGNATEAANALATGFDAVMNTWKSWTLLPFAGTWARDAQGMALASYAGGAIDVAKTLPHAKGALMRNAGAIPLKGGRTMSYSVAREHALANNLIQGEIGGLEGGLGREATGSGWQQMVVGSKENNAWRKGLEGTKTTLSYTLGVKNPGLQLISRGRQFTDDIFKMNFFVDRLMKGDSVTQAAWETKKYLFASENLTRVERSVMGRIFPFYRWLRLNLPLQLELALTKTRVHSIPWNVKQSMNGMIIEPQDREWIPKMVENMYNVAYKVDRAAGGTQQKYKFLVGKGWWNFADLAMIDTAFRQGPWRTLESQVVTQANPLIGLAYQGMSGRNPMTGKPPQYMQFGGKFLGAYWDDPMAIAAMRSIRLLNTINEFTKDIPPGPDQRTRLESFGKWLTGVSSMGASIPWSKYKALQTKQDLLRSYLQQIEYNHARGNIEGAQYLLERARKANLIPESEFRD